MPLSSPSHTLCCLFLLFFLCSTGCSYVVDENVVPDVPLDQPYSISEQDMAADDGKKWWKTFEDPLLDDILKTFFTGNFSLKQGYARLKQAQTLRSQAEARLFPELNSSIATSSTWTSDGEDEKDSSLQLALSWEIDVWNRLSSSEKAFALEAEAAEDALQDTALILSAQVADTYFQIIEQKLQLALLDQQIRVNEIFLELIELRFANGAASVVDIYQQRQLLASIQTQIPVARSRQKTLQHRLHVLLGGQPSRQSRRVGENLPQPGPLPQLGLPANLLVNRPDLRAARKNLIAADYRVAEAIANRLPQIKLLGSSGVEGRNFSGDDLFLSLIAEAVTPIVDWGRRKKDVARHQAIVEEEIALYSKTFLAAIEEVENALWQEKEQEELIRSLKEQLALAQANLTESRNRYMQGLTDYLPVLTALNSLQQLERDLLLSRRQLISFRILLYRALGGRPIGKS